MLVFITGASGFVGGAATQALTLAGHTVRAMSRTERSDAAIRALGATPVRSALGAVTAEHLAGCDAIVHCAAFVEQWGTRAQFWAANVEGTAQLLEVARAAGVRRFLHMSTEAVLFAGQHLRGIDETCPYPARAPYLYAETKAEAERRVLAASDPAGGFTTIVLRPRLVWGPGDQTILPTLAAAVREGRYAWLDGGRHKTSTVHIANLTHAIKLALTAGRSGEAYFVTDGEDSTYREFLGALLASQGLSPPERSLPGALGRAAAAILETGFRLVRAQSEPPLTRFAAAMLSHECTLRIDKARRDLGYAPIVSVTQGLAQMPRLAR